MEALKEYASVVTAVVTVVAALGALGLWAIHAEVTPEINRLEGRIDANQLLLKQIDRKIDVKFDAMNARFEAIDARFERVDGELKTIRNDIKTILLRLPGKAEAR